MRNTLSRVIAFAGLVMLCIAGPNKSYAQKHPMDAFFGLFSGVVAVMGEADTSTREVQVHIYPDDDDDENFLIDWTTVIHRETGGDKEASYSIHFAPSERKDIYSSAMRKNMFGNWVPLNPLKGDPYVWARLKDNTLTVYAMIITDDGGYEMQQYDRTLRDDGHMKLVFTRIRNGEALRSIEGLLMRVDDE